MRITGIELFVVGFDLAEPLVNAALTISRRDALLVRISTQSGLCGWGETYSSPHASAAYIRARLAGKLLGRDASGINALYRDMLATVGYDQRGVSMMAISAIDIALHDIVARSRNLPVHALLGGAVTKRIPAYASAPFLKPGEAPYAHYPAAIEDLRAKNFLAYKPRIGLDPRSDARAILQLRGLLGPDAALMVDANRGYSAPAIIEAARRMEDAHLLWIEEPVGPEDMTGYRFCARHIHTPLAAGEALGSTGAFRDLLAADVVSIVQPDISVCGGFSGMRRIAALVEAHGLPVLPHAFGTLVNFNASLNMAALLTPSRSAGAFSYPFLEVDTTDNPLLALCGTIAPGADGKLGIPGSAGLGFELDPARLEPWVTGHDALTL